MTPSQRAGTRQTGELPQSRGRPATFSGCLVGGAVGDALGAPIEFHALADIRRQFGASGIREFEPVYGRRGAITDDTQMTLFTAEGLLRGWTRGAEKGIVDLPAMVHRAYLRWLDTQGYRTEAGAAPPEQSWLSTMPALRSRRAPGNTCLSALRTGRMGTTDNHINASKGCGGVMRVAPAGLVGSDSFDLGCRLAAITHGHPSGYLAAGVFSGVIGSVVQGATLSEAIADALARLKACPGHTECLVAVESALRLAQQARRGAESVERLGSGWVAEEALAIALYCALVAETFEEGVLLAVNHGGDSDSTGSMTGNLLGALLGVEAIPIRWLAELELRDEIEQVAEDLFARFVLGTRTDVDVAAERYPGW